MRMFKLMTTIMIVCMGPYVTLGAENTEWIDLFNGQDLSGWSASEHKDTFSVEDGVIVSRGERSHLFYAGPVNGAKFKNFELKVDVKTEPGANGGIYFHTTYQEEGWPKQGYEVQVNNTFVKDPRKSGSLYAVQDVFATVAKDNTWYTTHVIVRGKRIVIKIDGRTIVDWTEPEGHRPPIKTKGRVLGTGTIALQGHDPGSVVRYRNIKIKPLTDTIPSFVAAKSWVSLFDGKSLKGWKQINGTAQYKVVENTIKGTTVEGSPNSFLCSRPYRDFELEFDVKVDPRLNSGVQIRSNSLPEYRKGRVHGYQVEIATNGNAGFIYDEARRGWLSHDREDSLARQAFRKDDWNHYRVVCVGDIIRTWVNTIPVTEIIDSVTGKGFIGLQVHSFKGDSPASVQWRNLRIKELQPQPRQKTKIVVVTGGHKFQQEPFTELFESMRNVDFTESKQTDDSELFEDITDWDYDVIVFYNMTQQISQQRQENLLKLLEQGVGIVALHHTFAAFNDWPQFKDVIGVHYFLKNSEGAEKSKYKHDLDMSIQVANKQHAITRRLQDFEIHDEAYNSMWHAKDNHVLLTCDHPESDEPIAWTRVYKHARICTIQLGHDGKAYSNDSYRRLVTNAIRWVSQK